MAISIADGFQYLGNKPLDSRIKYATLADLIAVSEANLYDGCEAYVTATKKYYSFDSSNTADPTLGKWRERTSGGGGGGVTEYSELTGKPSIEGVELDGEMTAEDLGLAKEEDIPDVPTKTSDLTNDSGFITNVVNDLVNYYLKTETYSKTETDSLIAAIKNSRFEVVSVLPTEDIKTNVIYLVPSSDPQTANAKDEYINLDGTSAGWELIGSTDIDLSGYVTTSDLNTALADYTSTADLTTLLAAKQDSFQFATMPTPAATYANGKVYQFIGTTDSTYTHGFFYECKESGGVYAWENVNVQSGGGSDSAIINGYAYTEPFEPTGVMDYINWIRNHTDKTILVPNENIFSGKTANYLYMVLAPAAAYLLFSEFPFNLKVYYLNRSGTKIFNSTRLSQDGTTIVGFNSNGTFTYVNGITQAKQVSIHDEVDCDYLADNNKEAQLFVTPNINLLSNMYKDNTVVIENPLAFYSDSSHTMLITPETGKFYVDTPTGDIYEWDGTKYKRIGSQDVPTKTSDLVNDSGFITKAVNDLVNYYLKSETYSKTEVDALIGAISGMHFVSVSELPTTDIQTNAIYLVPSADAQTQNIKDEYINLDGTTSGWEKIGSSQIDLSGYVTDTELTTALADYTTTANLTTLLSEKQDKAQFGVMPSASIDYAGRIVQYTGVTDSSYTHGYFYECKESDGSYSWVQTNVQSSSGGGSSGHTIVDSEDTTMTARASLKFGEGFDVTDDSTNDETVVTPNVMQSGDMDDVINPLPSVRPSKVKYSTSEQVIGEWIDGKPLYQKTFSFTTPSTTNTETYIVLDNSLSVDNCFIVNGYFSYAYSNGITGFTPLNMDIDPNNAYSCVIPVNGDQTKSSDNKELAIYMKVKYSSYINRPAIITVQYTKTTDPTPNL